MIDAILSTMENEEQRNELAEFYSKHKSKLYAIAMSKLHNQSDAEDAVQEVFLRIADKPEKFFAIPSANRPEYANVIVSNIAIDLFNSKNKIPTSPLEDYELEDEAPSIENNLLAKISRSEILEFVDTLPVSQQNVLILHCFFDLSIDDTAQRLNISLDVAIQRLKMARKAIKKFVDERRKSYE